MKLFERLFERKAPTGREPVKDRRPATREEMAELGQRFATPQPEMQTVRRSRLFGAHSEDDMAVGGSYR